MNVVKAALSLLPLLLFNGTAVAQATGQATLWHEGAKRVQTAQCPTTIDGSQGHCLSIRADNGHDVSTLGAGYVGVKLLWSKQSHQGGPDVLVLGDYGGSGGNSDLIAVSFSPDPVIQKIGGDRVDAVEVTDSNGTFGFDLPFSISMFNGASHADDTMVPLPIVWEAGNFALNLKELESRSYSKQDIHFRELAIRYELNRWAEDSYPATDLYPVKTTGGTPVTAQALTELVLSGRADLARQILHKNWPASFNDGAVPMGGETRFWSSLCKAIVSNDDWRRFQLTRLPHSAEVEKAAMAVL